MTFSPALACVIGSWDAISAQSSWVDAANDVKCARCSVVPLMPSQYAQPAGWHGAGRGMRQTRG